MRRIMLMGTAALVMAAMALSGVAQARPIGDSADAKCARLAIKTLGASFNPSNYTFIGGTEGNDTLTGQGTDGPDVFCGFGGNDEIGTLAEGDIFIGGAGGDSVIYNDGTFYGEEGNDVVASNNGTFYGGAGNDYVFIDNSGTFYGEEGNDNVFENTGTFYGGVDGDSVDFNYGTFYGGEGHDIVSDNYGVFFP